ncbi:MAG: hypothetical protein LUE20_03790 [Oscillospiraceae bacterium]|nr:hypothetical protein [Oscillospiraceae bacterium]
MDRKIKQITDNIHETIYISMLESEMMSTAYFYRLNDIYQSSTVYMTFPSNRTKRYEHSIGVMDIASSMLFSAVSNAGKDTRNEFFKQMILKFDELIRTLFKSSNSISAQYYTPLRSEIEDLFTNIKANCNLNPKLSEINKTRHIVGEILGDAISGNILADPALDSFQFYSVGAQENAYSRATSCYGSIDLFLYRCILQAVRIVALFHDVGHPPYSHIMEDVLIDLYGECKKISEEDPSNEEAREFIDTMEQYITGDRAQQCQMITTKMNFKNEHLHERIGLSLIQSTINDVMPNVLKGILAKNVSPEQKLSKILFYITSVEFAMSALVNKDTFFHSIHSIVDGVLDADRFDYIVRDTYNSGIDWGKIPYKRIINSAKLVFLEKWGDRELDNDKKPFVIAYPQKLGEDISDLLIIRYKIFARINLHHKCMKTAAVLQSAVKELAIDYIQPKDHEPICPDIKMLWSALEISAGRRMDRIIQWNDSRLISALHEALITLKTQNPFLNNTKYDNLRCDLEEVLLGRKSYYSLIKRERDCHDFVKKVFCNAHLTDELLEHCQEGELKKYYNERESQSTCKDLDLCSEENMDNLSFPMLRAEDSYRRIRILRSVMKTGDWEILNSCMPLDDKCIADKMRETLDRLVENEMIISYKLIVNSGREKTGLPSHKTEFDEIYLVSDDNEVTVFDSLSLETEVEAIERSIPWIFIYFVPPKDVRNPKELWSIIFEALASEVGGSLHVRAMDELFYKYTLKTAME